MVISNLSIQWSGSCLASSQTKSATVSVDTYRNLIEVTYFNNDRRGYFSGYFQLGAIQGPATQSDPTCLGKTHTNTEGFNAIHQMEVRKWMTAHFTKH